MDLRPCTTSCQLIDQALKRLQWFAANCKKTVEEYYRATIVVRPIAMANAFVSVEASYRDGEGDDIILASGESVPPFLGTERIVKNDLWSQPMTEKHCLALFQTLPDLWSAVQQQNAAMSPINVMNTAMLQWCQGFADSAIGTAFGANFYNSVRVFSPVSPICHAALQTIHLRLPVGFGETVVNYLMACLNGCDSSSAMGIPMRVVMNSLPRIYQKEQLFGGFQVAQLKYAATLDAAVVAGHLNKSLVCDISETKRNSALLLRVVFHHFLLQTQFAMAQIEAIAFSLGHFSAVTKYAVVSESQLRLQLEGLKWDPELALSPRGMKYSTGKRIVSISVKYLMDAATSGLQRFDGGTLRLDDAHLAQLRGVQGCASRKDFVSLEKMLHNVWRTPLRFVEK
jgi:hypothetical protein